MDMYSDTTPPSQIKNHGSRIEDCHSKLDILLTYPVMLRSIVLSRRRLGNPLVVYIKSLWTLELIFLPTI